MSTRTVESFRKPRQQQTRHFYDNKIVLIALTAALAFFAASAAQVAVYAQDVPTSPTILELIQQANQSFTTIMGVIAGIVGFASAVAAGIFAKNKENKIARDATSWLEFISEKVQEIDKEGKETFVDLLKNGAKYDTVLEVLKESVPNFKENWDKAAPKVKEGLEKADKVGEDWQKQIDKIWSVTPETDPVGSDEPAEVKNVT